MLDLSAEIERLLELMGLANVWQVIETLTNAMGDIVTLQNVAGRQVGVVFIHFSGDDKAKIARIRSAIDKATRWP